MFVMYYGIIDYGTHNLSTSICSENTLTMSSKFPKILLLRKFILLEKSIQDYFFKF